MADVKSRREIRADAVVILKAANTLAGAEVHNWRTDDWWSSAKAGLNVLTPAQVGAQEGRQGAPQFESGLSLVIEAVVSGNEAAQDTLDILVDQAIDALLTNAEFVKQFEAVTSLGRTFGVAKGTDRRSASAEVTIGLQMTEIYEPVIADPLVELRADWDPDHEAGGRPPLKDIVILEQPTE